MPSTARARLLTDLSDPALWDMALAALAASSGDAASAARHLDAATRLCVRLRATPPDGYAARDLAKRGQDLAVELGLEGPRTQAETLLREATDMLSSA
jgi:hypothetical protein